MTHSTTRLGLNIADGTDAVNAFPGGPDAQSMGVLDAAMVITEGTISARPAAGTYGKAYYATDSIQFFLDNGGTWMPQWFSTSAVSVSTAAVGGQHLSCAPGVTITLPTATQNIPVAITAGTAVTGASPVTVSGGSTSIIGPGGLNATSFLLGTAGATVILQGNGSNWRMISGQQDSGWVALSLASNITSGGFGASARLQGDLVQLKGTLTNGTGSSDSGTLATVPSASGARPTGTVDLTAALVTSGTVVPVQITSAGALTVVNATFPNSGVLSLDGLSYSLS